ncbi:dipeptide ABC transporter ATP-binding protein [Fusibacter paucivorans]|uniref:Dipeptide ABC transporter ATP-binding protein n=1 Tax=Fusibacter paucivorans TaxID=76009 RepID=A0ABS5PSH1_9FIRM|nr:dipeptide ABC transporter ATP-binding protein [Fusibacter paucivorans]MBS7527316.1 dipeptide ABC transporter ATP-binding protein [Fusibacter paucivorans]
MSELLMTASSLKKYYEVKVQSVFSGGKSKEVVKAVDGVDIEIGKGETVALVGESGCGKSTLGRLLINLISPTDGDVVFKGESIYGLRGKHDKAFRKDASIIFQDPYASLNPRMKVKDLIGEPLLTHGMTNAKERYEKVSELMKISGLKPEYANRYPHQFSGGQRQRIGIARALALNPSLIVCDEAVSALDVSIQAQILNLLKSLQKDYDLTYLFISHDLSVVRYISDKVYVMYLGKIVEYGDPKSLYTDPKHPYTKFLLDAVPIPDPSQRNREKMILEGDIPSAINPPSGCRFRTRCPFATDKCKQEIPEIIQMEHRGYACHYPL